MEKLYLRLQDWKKSETVIVNVGLIVIILLLLLWLYLEFQFGSGKKGEPIGRITYRINESQRKFSSNFLWKDLDVNSNIYNFDTVRTDTGATVHVLLLDKTEIQLEENTMVVFDLSNDSLNIDLFNGKLRLDSMNAEKSKQIKISNGDSTINMKKGVVQFKKIATANVNVNLIDGKAELIRNDSIDNLERGEEVKIRGVKLVKDKKKFRLLSPINSRYFLTRKSVDVIFEWEGENKNDSYILEVYNTSLKNVQIFTKEVTKDSYSYTLNPGKYTWTLSDTKREHTETNSFYIADDNPVTLHTPKPESYFEYEKELPRILFSWSKNEFIRHYKLEISDSKNFEKINYELTTENETSIVDNLTSGKYYYRVITKTEFPDSLSKVSQVNSFTINQKVDPKKVTQKEERNLQPANEDIPTLNLISPINESELETDRIQFSWEKVKENPDYTLELSKTPEFSEIIVNRKSKLNQLTVTLPEDGKFYWRVKGLAKDGRILTSKQLSFNYHYSPTPLIVFPANNSEVDVLKMDKFVFKWSKMENAIFYNFELKKLATNESVIRESRLKSTEYALEDFTLLKTGNYECIVTARILSKNSEEITTKPKTHKFKVYLSQKAEKKDIKFISPENIYIER